jgi:hypothetical protein
MTCNSSILSALRWRTLSKKLPINDANVSTFTEKAEYLLHLIQQEQQETEDKDQVALEQAAKKKPRKPRAEKVPKANSTPSKVSLHKEQVKKSKCVDHDDDPFATSSEED